MKRYGQGGLREPLTEFNAGGSHEENPLGGIPQGFGANGLPNLVEEGETKFEDYIFPDSREITEEVAKAFSLGKKAIGKTYAQVSKIYEKADTPTRKDMMARLQAAAEATKPQQPQQQGNMMEGGGFMGPLQGMLSGMKTMTTDPNAAGAPTPEGQAVGQVASTAANMAVPGLGMVMEGAGALGNVAGDAIGGDIGTGLKTQANPFSQIGNKDLSVLEQFAPLTPFGGFAIAGKLNDKKAEQDRKNTTMQNQAYVNAFKKGGNLYSNGGSPYDWTQAMHQGLGEAQEYATGMRGSLSSGGGFSQEQPVGIQPQGYMPAQGGSTQLLGPVSGNNTNTEEGDDDIPWWKKAATTAGRLAPAAMNAFQLFTMDDPEVESLDRLESRYNPSFVNEKTLQINQDQAFNTQMAKMRNMGGSEAQKRAMAQGMGLDRAKGLSDAYFKANQVNRDERRFGQQYNQRNDTINLRQDTLEKDWNARNRANFETQQSKLMSGIAENVGDYALEERRMMYPELMGMGYDAYGRPINRPTNVGRQGGSLSKGFENYMEFLLGDKIKGK